jgi:hypothetical protein
VRTRIRIEGVGDVGDGIAIGIGVRGIRAAVTRRSGRRRAAGDQTRERKKNSQCSELRTSCHVHPARSARFAEIMRAAGPSMRRVAVGRRQETRRGGRSIVGSRGIGFDDVQHVTARDERAGSRHDAHAATRETRAFAIADATRAAMCPSS